MLQAKNKTLFAPYILYKKLAHTVLQEEFARYFECKLLNNIIINFV